MSTFVSELVPSSLWEHFDALLRIPRGSKSEGAAREYVAEVARGRGLRVESDAAGNLVVRKPGAPGRSGAPGVVLQAHLDMVQEKNADIEHDFARDPIRPVRDGDWLRADGTTLGADNGIGVAAMLSILEADFDHGPLELLFTIDEETGLTGAGALSEDLLGSRLLVNLDSEEEGVVTIGCAGGGDSVLRLPVRDEPVSGGTRLAVSVSGLLGGHSGVDIHRQRGNAIRILARACRAAADATGARVARFSGGNARNAIPREASADLVVEDSAYVGICRSALEGAFGVASTELARSDPGFEHEVQSGGVPDTAWDEASTRRALDLLIALPHGVMEMSLDLPGLVQTSCNLAVARREDDELYVMQHARSSIGGSLDDLRRRIRSIADLAGASVREGTAYPAWEPDIESDLLATIRATYEEVLGRAPEVGAMHAGLECGIIGQKYPAMDMVSFGPQIEFPHSPGERVRIGSVAPFYEVLCRTLERVAS